MHADLKAIQMTITRATEYVMGGVGSQMALVKDLDDAYKAIEVLMRENPDTPGISTLYDDGTIYEDTHVGVAKDEDISWDEDAED